MNQTKKVRKQIGCGYEALVALVTMLKHSMELGGVTQARLDSMLGHARNLSDSHRAAVNAMRNGCGEKAVNAILTKRKGVEAKLRKATGVLADLERDLTAEGQQWYGLRKLIFLRLVEAIRATVDAYTKSIFDLERFNDEVSE